MQSRMFHRPESPVVRKLALLPLVLIGSMLFWSMALGLGAVSLVAVAGLQADDNSDAPDLPEVPPSATEPMPGHAAEPITVHIQESSEPEDVNDNAGAVLPVSAQEE
jgi:hypothetical protein